MTVTNSTREFPRRPVLGGSAIVTASTSMGETVSAVGRQAEVECSSALVGPDPVPVALEINRSEGIRSVRCLVRAALASMAILLSLHLPVAAQESTPAAATSTLTTAELDQLVAPIALYPDPVVAQILMAATYPLEVVEANRWLQNPSNVVLKGEPLATALQQQPWDPAVKSLILFPQLLHMMDADLQWTERLGDAFLAQQADVMNAIQRLRQRAQAAGALASTPQQAVSTEDQEIAIEPATPDVVYLPAYNPWCIYGAWPYPDYPPAYFGSWSGTCTPADYILDFGPAIYPPLGFWAWGALDWRHRFIRINRERFERFHTGHEPPDGPWEHDPIHRHGVPYRDSTTAARFSGPTDTTRRELRGFVPRSTIIAPATPPGQAIGSRPTTINRQMVSPTMPQHPLPPTFESIGRGAQVRVEAARGFSSRMAPVMPTAPMPSVHAAPMPSVSGGGFGGFRGGPIGGGFHGGGGVHR